MPPPDPNNPIIIPAAKTELPKHKNVDPATGESSGGSKGGSPRLTWGGNSPVQASPRPPPPPGGSGTGGQSGNTPDQPPPAVDRRVVISVTGKNTVDMPQYFSKISLNLQGNKKILETLLAAAKFVIGKSDSQDTVEITSETSDGVTPLDTNLETKILSPHMTTCNVVLTPKEGNVIVVPPGGSITVFAKGVSGAKSSKMYAVTVTEDWVNAQGERTPGAVEKFKAQVPFELS